LVVEVVEDSMVVGVLEVIEPQLGFLLLLEHMQL
jgi:hypothetical protein